MKANIGKTLSGVVFIRTPEIDEPVLTALDKVNLKITYAFLSHNEGLPKQFKSTKAINKIDYISPNNSNSELFNEWSVDETILKNNKDTESLFYKMCDFIDWDGYQFSMRERRIFFLNSLEYSLAILRTSPDFILFTDTPHCPFDACFWQLSEKQGIPCFIVREFLNIPGRFFLHDGISPEKMISLEESSGEKDIEDIDRFITKTTAGNLPRLTKSANKRSRSLIFSKWKFLWNLYRLELLANMAVYVSLFFRLGRRLALIIYSKLKNKTHAPFNPILPDSLKFRGLSLDKFQMSFIKDYFVLVKSLQVKRLHLLKYESTTFSPNFPTSKPFIYFPLHYQPEATTYPYGVEYIDQIVALRILSAVAGDQFDIYIKEHPDTFNSSFQAWSRGNFSRCIEFYDELTELKGAKILPIETDNNLILKHCSAVMSITGVATLEAALNGIPAAVFGAAWFSDCPGIYDVSSKKKLRSFFENVLSDYSSSNIQAKKWLRDFGSKSIQAGGLNAFNDKHQTSNLYLSVAKKMANYIQVESRKKNFEEDLPSNYKSDSQYLSHDNKNQFSKQENHFTGRTELNS